MTAQTPLERAAAEFAASRVALAGFALLALLLLAALFAPWISPQNPYDLSQLDLLDSRLAPGARSALPEVRSASAARMRSVLCFTSSRRSR